VAPYTWLGGQRAKPISSLALVSSQDKFRVSCLGQPVRQEELRSPPAASSGRAIELGHSLTDQEANNQRGCRQPEPGSATGPTDTAHSDQVFPLARLRFQRGARFLVENLLAELDALIADVYAGASHQPPDLILALAADGATGVAAALLTHRHGRLRRCLAHLNRAGRSPAAPTN
jgi:hypothetical protein